MPARYRARGAYRFGINYNKYITIYTRDKLQLYATVPQWSHTSEETRTPRMYFKRNQTLSSETCAPFAPGTLVMSYCMLVIEGDALPPGVPVASS